MKVGLDLDFTITAMPQFFRLLAAALLDNGHEVHIITYRDAEPETEEELRQLGVRYTRLHLPTNDEQPHVWKASLARQLDLDLMIDDAPEVIAALPTGVSGRLQARMGKWRDAR